MIANATTTVDSEKTCAEIQRMLSKAGARSIAMQFDMAGCPSEIAFQIMVNDTAMAFRLPCNWVGVLDVIKREKKIAARFKNALHARQVAWRIIKDWLRAQLALIEAGATTMQEVMLPWAITSDGTTVGQRVLSGQTDILRLN